MSTWKGCGTTYYGWTHEENGTATATNWVVALMFPIVPLQRVRLRILSPDDDRFFSLRLIDHYEVLEVLDRDYRSILLTFVRAYVLFPLALILPWVLLFVVRIVARSLGYNDGELRSMMNSIMPVFGGLNVVYLIGLGLFVVRRSRGRKTM
jgi:hypothetical protein